MTNSTEKEVKEMEDSKNDIENNLEDKVEKSLSDENLDSDEENKEVEKKPEESKEKSIEENYVRLMADFQNYKKRVEKQQSEIFNFANEKLITSLLDVLDNFERGLTSKNDEDEAVKSFKSGIEISFNQLKSVLEDAGLKEIDALDKPFDPNYHNGVLSEEKEGVEEGIVLEVLQKGYTLKEKVIRPTMVKVSK